MKKLLYIATIISILNFDFVNAAWLRKSKRVCFLLIFGCFQFSICQSQPQQHFSDPLLQGYIAEALEHNSDLLTARLALEQSETMLRQARLSYLPNVSLAPSLNYSNNRENSPSTWCAVGSADNRLTYELPLTMSWELNFGGKLHHQKEMAEAVLLKDSVLLRYVQIQLTADVANAYYTLVMLDRQRAITLEAVRNQEENLRVLRALKEVGQQNETAVSQAEASYQAVVASLPTLEAQIRKTETALCLLLGRQPDSLARSPWEEAVQFSILNSQFSILNSVSARPDVLAAEYQLRAAFSNVRVARAEFYPTLTISGSTGWTSDGVTLNPAQILLNAIASLSQPLFAQGRLKANLKVAQAQQEQAQIAF